MKKSRQGRIMHPKGRKEKQSSKGTFVKGMTKPLPSSLLAHPLLEPAVRKILKGYSGIYVLYDGKVIYYVGLTKNLFGRIGGHLKDRHRRKWDHFAIFRIKRAGFLKDVETLLLRVVRPPGNRGMGHIARGGDLTKVLRSEFRVQKRKMAQLEKAFMK
jgi:hypothetical protein